MRTISIGLWQSFINSLTTTITSSDDILCVVSVLRVFGIIFYRYRTTVVVPHYHFPEHIPVGFTCVSLEWFP